MPELPAAVVGHARPSPPPFPGLTYSNARTRAGFVEWCRAWAEYSDWMRPGSGAVPKAVLAAEIGYPMAEIVHVILVNLGDLVRGRLTHGA